MQRQPRPPWMVLAAIILLAISFLTTCTAIAGMLVLWQAGDFLALGCILLACIIALRLTIDALQGH